ncbi:AEC family transporter [Microbacterium sp. LWO12-1.2]|uniref:AEC family transporter n=1 Tax=Microbacterium sp. LWO12-1.2 TaxID=3135261 RepID=UPI0034450B04
MLDTLTGFAVVAVAIVIGYVIARVDLLGPHARHVLGRLIFFVLSPFLLFSVLAHADAKMLFSSLLPVSAIAAVAVIAVYVLVARFVWHRSIAETVIGALSAGQVNSNNIGLPLSLYLLGSAAFPAPVILLQLLIFTPISLTILDAVTSEHVSLMRTLRRTATNPIILGALLGTIVSLSGIALPAIVMDPAQLIADAAVPVLLISYGMSLHGQRVLGARGHRRDVILASGLKLAFMPAIAWFVAEVVFGLSSSEVLIVTVLAALPTAQNVFNYSQRYGVGEPISRDTVFVTTLGCLPVLVLIMSLLG